MVSLTAGGTPDAQAEEEREAGQVQVALRVELLSVVAVLEAEVVETVVRRGGGLRVHLEHALEGIDKQHSHEDEGDAHRVVDLGHNLTGREEVEQLAAHREWQRHLRQVSHGGL